VDGKKSVAFKVFSRCHRFVEGKRQTKKEDLRWSLESAFVHVMLMLSESRRVVVYFNSYAQIRQIVRILTLESVTFVLLVKRIRKAQL